MKIGHRKLISQEEQYDLQYQQNTEAPFNQ